VWDFTESWELTAYRGVGAAPSDFLRLWGHRGSHTLVTSSDQPPHPTREPAAQLDLDATWLLRHLSFKTECVSPVFTIDRNDSACATPRRNK
jgi:hypothetical protein